MKINVKQDHAAERRKTYPPIADQLDAIWKFIASAGGQPPADVRAMLNRILDVKTRFPKP